MGDDAEYFIEQMEEEDLLKRYAKESERTTCDFCYINEDKDDEELFSWAPKRSAGWLTKLHRYNIGNCVYYAQLDDEYHESETGHIDKNNLKKVKNAHQADCEVLIASQDNIKNLKEQVNIVGSDQLEKYVFSEIIRSMIKIMESKIDTKEFIFILWF